MAKVELRGCPIRSVAQASSLRVCEKDDRLEAYPTIKCHFSESLSGLAASQDRWSSANAHLMDETRKTARTSQRVDPARNRVQVVALALNDYTKHGTKRLTRCLKLASGWIHSLKSIRVA